MNSSADRRVAFLRSLVPYAGLCLSVAALVVLAITLRRLSAAGQTITLQAEFQSQRLLEEQILSLGRHCEALEQLVSSQLQDPAASAEQQPRIDCEALASRIEELKQLAAELQAQTLEQARHSGAPDAASQRRAELVMSRNYAEALAAYKAQFLDPGVPDEIKVDTLALLRMFPDHFSPRDDQVALVAADMLERSPKRTIRLGICRNLKGLASEAVIPALLRVLANDSDVAIREEAAETLERFVERADVRLALERAAVGDPASRVRDQAAKSLAKHK